MRETQDIIRKGKKGKEKKRYARRGVSSFYFLPYKQAMGDMEKAILGCCWTVYERK